MTNRITINPILEHCEIGSKAIVIIKQLEFFLQTQADRQKFLNEFESHQLWRDPKKPFKMMNLARTIGKYHYQYDTPDQLNQMDLKDALERLFLQPVRVSTVKKIKELGVELQQLIEYKKANPQEGLIIALAMVS